MAVIKMKWHLTYIIFGKTLLLGPFVFAVNLYVYASDVPYIAFSSKGNENYDIYTKRIPSRNIFKRSEGYFTWKIAKTLRNS